MKKAILGLALLAMLSNPAVAALVFDDFNVDNGHFGYHPGFSSGSVGEATTGTLSTSTRITTDGPLEGAGHQELILRHDGTATNMRIRHLSGGPPYTSTQSGNPAFNLTFVTSAGVDGWIGLYMKQSAANTGWTVGLNLDDSTNTGGGMDMGVNKPIIADDQWHLYEWNLDDDTQWNAVTSIGGDGTIQNGQHSIDSIYIFTNTTGTANQARAPLYIDFIAKSDSGSIAALLPGPAVPEIGSFAALGIVSLLSAGAVWFRKRLGRATA